MSKRDVRLFLDDILGAIAKIERYSTGLSFQQFENNDMASDAVVRNLEIVGEAAKHIPAKLRDQYPQLDWARVVGFRNIVVHAYFAVDLNIVWTIATERLPELKITVLQMLQDMEGRTDGLAR